jgi:CRP-like cAMP-binding protein
MSARDALRTVPWLSSLSDAELDALAKETDRRTFAPGRALVTELEVGEDLFIVIEGSALATVAVGAGGARREVGTLGPGAACGEASLLTRELRSATVTAVTPVVALRLTRRDFEELVTRHPAIVVHFAHVIAHRISETDSVLDAFLDEKGPGPAAAERLAGHSSAVVVSRGSVLRTWREFVASRGRELPSLALASFMVTLAVVRGVAGSLSGEHVLFDFLRAAYVSGIALVFVATAVSLVRFRAKVQRVVALAEGAGFALILNELSVFLAFDTFYLDMTTPDPNLVFSAETLYRRSESGWAVMLMAAFLLQLALLRPFYRRLAFVVRTRLVGTHRT